MLSHQGWRHSGGGTCSGGGSGGSDVQTCTSLFGYEMQIYTTSRSHGNQIFTFTTVLLQQNNYVRNGQRLLLTCVHVCMSCIYNMYTRLDYYMCTCAHGNMHTHNYFFIYRYTFLYF